MAFDTCNHFACFAAELTAPDAGDHLTCFFVKVTGARALLKPKILAQIFV